MPRYQVATEFFYGDRLIPAGEEVEYPGVPGSNLIPLDDAAKAAVAAAAARRAEQAAVVVSKAGGIGEETEALIRALVGRVAAVEAASSASVDLSGYVRHSDIAPLSEAITALRADVDEHDIGVTLIHDRLVEVEGVLAKMTAPALAPESPAAPTEVAVPPAEPAPEASADAVPEAPPEAPAEPIGPPPEMAAPEEPAG